MGPLIGVTLFLAVLLLLGVGCWAIVRDGERRLARWARSQNFDLIRCERTLDDLGIRQPAWRIRVRLPSGETRDGWARAGWSDGAPEVTWAEPGASAFR